MGYISTREREASAALYRRAQHPEEPSGLTPAEARLFGLVRERVRVEGLTLGDFGAAPEAVAVVQRGLFE